MNDRKLIMGMLKDIEGMMASDTSGDEYIHTAKSYVGSAILLLAASQRKHEKEHPEEKTIEFDEIHNESPHPMQINHYADTATIPLECLNYDMRTMLDEIDGGGVL